MANPGGNYPGRQIFLGNIDGNPAFAYFGSGRSRKSQERYATLFLERENAIRINPLDPDEPFDTFRHYQAVRIDPETGLLLVSNSQAPNDAVFEAYKFRNEQRKISYPILRLMSILSSIGPEYDAYKTPRIIGVFVSQDTGYGEFGAGMVNETENASCTQLVSTVKNTMHFLQTYNGKGGCDPFDFDMLFPNKTLVTVDARTSRELAEEIYETSDYIHAEHGELRVWCVAGVRNGSGPGGWDIAIKNRHKSHEAYV